MEVSYEELKKEQRTVEVDESDFALLNDILVECFIQRLQNFGLANPFMPFEEKAAEICQRNGVDTTDRFGVTCFYKALLLRENTNLGG